MMDNNYLVAHIGVDAWRLLRAEDPEAYLDSLWATAKQEILRAFYERFPGQEPINAHP